MYYMPQPVPGPETAITFPLPRLVAQHLGIDTRKDWRQNYDKIWQVTEWAKSSIQSENAKEIINFLVKRANQMPSLGASRLVELNLARQFDEQKQMEQESRRGLVASKPQPKPQPKPKLPAPKPKPKAPEASPVAKAPKKIVDPKVKADPKDKEFNDLIIERFSLLKTPEEKKQHWDILCSEGIITKENARTFNHLIPENSMTQEGGTI